MQPHKLQCYFCNSLFIPHYSWHKRFCSKNCREKYWAKKKKENQWKPFHGIFKKCEYCNTKYKPIRDSQKYCSVKCSNKMHPPPPNRLIPKYWTNKKWLKQNYFKPQISISQLSKQIGCSRITIAKWLKRLELKSLPKSIVQKGNKNPFYRKKHSKKTKKKLKGPRPHTAGANNHSWTGGMNKCIDCEKQLNGYKAKRCEKCSFAYYIGKNNQNWKGGKEPYYGPDWQSHQKQARKRDNNTCQDCGLYQIKPRLHVHHKIPFRYFRLEKHQEANNLANLITVYVPCHGKRHKIINSFNYQFLTDFPEYQNLPKS